VAAVSQFYVCEGQVMRLRDEKFVAFSLAAHTKKPTHENADSII